MTDPNVLIEEQRGIVATADLAVAQAIERAERERHKLAGMESLFSAFTAAASERGSSALRVGPVEVKHKSGGRQPGSITKEWRQVLAHLGGEPFTAADLAAYPQLLFGRNVSVAEGRRRLDLFTTHGYVEEAGDSRYRVTPHAMQKFGLKSLIENGEATAEPDNRDEGAATPSHPPFDL